MVKEKIWFALPHLTVLSSPLYNKPNQICTSTCVQKRGIG